MDGQSERLHNPIKQTEVPEWPLIDVLAICCQKKIGLDEKLEKKIQSVFLRRPSCL